MFDQGRDEALLGVNQDKDLQEGDAAGEEKRLGIAQRDPHQANRTRHK